MVEIGPGTSAPVLAAHGPGRHETQHDGHDRDEDVQPHRIDGGEVALKLRIHPDGEREPHRENRTVALHVTPYRGGSVCRMVQLMKPLLIARTSLLRSSSCRFCCSTRSVSVPRRTPNPKTAAMRLRPSAAIAIVSLVIARAARRARRRSGSETG